MIPIQILLERFKGVKNTEKEKKQTILNILKDNNIEITLNQIYFSKNTIIIKAPPIIKTEILIKKNNILLSLKRAKETKLFLEVK